MRVRTLVKNAVRNAGTARDAARAGNVRVLASLLGPAARGTRGHGATVYCFPRTLSRVSKGAA